MKFLHYYQIECFSFFVGIFACIHSLFLYYFVYIFSDFPVPSPYFFDNKFCYIEFFRSYSFYSNFDVFHLAFLYFVLGIFVYIQAPFLYFFGNFFYYFHVCWALFLLLYFHLCPLLLMFRYNFEFEVWMTILTHYSTFQRDPLPCKLFQQLTLFELE
ncbi:unnamed protein product [Meloidogyne enterolobii]|uniref:Uncharacterized protein n=1 Tax=Meloidogyne enterolobii TaxID=390850 RepID=A0ACB1A2L8_MELEN